MHLTVMKGRVDKGTTVLLVLLALLVDLVASQELNTDSSQLDDMEEVQVVVGFNASLPCSIRAPDHDAPTLTLWYIADGEAPVYSYDERPGYHKGSQWADTDVFGSRAIYSAHSIPPALVLAQATVEDARLYRCRVDFQNTRSRVAWVNLTVIVPPRRTQLMVQNSPVNLGDRNDVICKASGGKSTPETILVWSVWVCVFMGLVHQALCVVIAVFPHELKKSRDIELARDECCGWEKKKFKKVDSTQCEKQHLFPAFIISLHNLRPSIVPYFILHTASVSVAEDAPSGFKFMDVTDPQLPLLFMATPVVGSGPTRHVTPQAVFPLRNFLTSCECIRRAFERQQRSKNSVSLGLELGTPPPQVVWLQRGSVVDSSYTHTGEETYNVLEVEATRADLTHPFFCKATNNDRIGPDTVQHERNVTCGPLSVTISGEEEPIAEGRSSTLTCTVIGSNPPALVTWYQQGQMIKPLHTVVRERDNVTTSVLTLNASRSDHMRQLVCRAVNALLPEETLEDILTLDVQYKPIVTMSLGRSLDPDNLREENDIFFDCKVDANPDPYKVEWWHDNDLVTQNLAEGVLVSESTLALQRVSREKSGSYQCRASNVEGDTTSDPVNISIKYAPRCAVSPSLRGVGLQEPINVTCEVDADPVDVTFTWTFNNSVRREQSEIVDSKRYTTEKLRSVLFYTPRSERDYGTLLCHAQNSVGLQTTPCSFTVISAGALGGYFV
ncbi:uncharacterized protein LOC134772367 [Penaeus indicus]|uniref:uncharacterized protein LOC134772367 n=1 Tax=Penaeus indicus TaxID=29960 RepID=UPI00300C3D71